MTSAVKIMVTKGVRQRGINWETGYDIYSLIYTKYITDMKLLYSTENSTKYSVMTSSRIEYKKAACMYMYVCMYRYIYLSFPGGSAVKNQPAAGDLSSLPGSERSPGEGSSFLGQPTDRGTCIHGVTKRQRVRQDLSTKHEHIYIYMSIESVMPSNHLILCRPLLLLPSVFPSIRVFSSESVLCIRWPSIGVSASASVLPMNIQD